MHLCEKELRVSVKSRTGLLLNLRRAVMKHIPDHQAPIRFVVTKSDDRNYDCEIGVMEADYTHAPIDNIFDISPRGPENMTQFNAVMLVPTGIGAEIGGHAGDAGSVARLLASACDTLITHPNVVNASDINELPENGLYVEGSVISRLLMGTIGLQRVRSNRVALVIDEHADPYFRDLAVNAASAARVTLGLDCSLVLKISDEVVMKSAYSTSGCACGEIKGLEFICNALNEHRSEFDAVAISSLVDVPEHYHAAYFKQDAEGMVNPWGGVEAMLTHALSLIFDVPTAHSPMMTSMAVMELDVGVVDPRKAAEAISTTYLHCILKGLHKSPRIVRDCTMFDHAGIITAADVSCLVIPDGCIGLPTLAALEQGIPVIAVKENRNRMKNDLMALPFGSGKLFIVDNYLEAVGVMTALKAGVAVPTVRRPLMITKIMGTSK